MKKPDLNRLISTIVTTEAELLQIHRLNKENLRAQVKPENQTNQGFVTWLYSMELLKKMHALAPGIVVKDADKIVGYALVALKEMGSFHTDLQAMFSNLRQLSYRGQPLYNFSFYCMGQICVDKDYRGLGIVNLLYQKHKEIYSSSYQLLITEISTSNRRSQKVHEKTGFKTIHTYNDALDEWNVVIWDWT
jgi:ribosomal protein S18 acetylase RimI-like enzyme